MLILCTTYIESHNSYSPEPGFLSAENFPPPPACKPLLTGFRTWQHAGAGSDFNFTERFRWPAVGRCDTQNPQKKKNWAGQGRSPISGLNRIKKSSFGPRLFTYLAALHEREMTWHVCRRCRVLAVHTSQKRIHTCTCVCVCVCHIFLGLRNTELNFMTVTKMQHPGQNITR